MSMKAILIQTKNRATINKMRLLTKKLIIHLNSLQKIF